MSAAGRWARRNRRRIGLATCLLVLVAGVSVAAVSGRHYAQALTANAAIARLARGATAEVPDGAPAELLDAGALFLTARDRIEEAEALGPAILASRDEGTIARFHMRVGNAHLKRAFDEIETGRLDDAVPQVNLAKAAYRRALGAAPDLLAAKVNLDIAMRLVRDFPRPPQDGEEEEGERPRNVWTDLPGMPRGFP